MSQPDQPLVSILMGSQNDDEFLRPLYATLEGFDVAFEKRVLSAHRQPVQLVQYLSSAEGTVRVFVAAAGYSAALPGVVAAHTLRPVIGVPVPAGPLQGIDALLSIVQMPGGIPVAAVALGSPGPKNAGLLAVSILALADTGLEAKLRAHRDQLAAG
jgi:5-(carboxyamino)imidazole ribonucleotide mutase